MASPVGFGRSIPLMQAADLAGAATGTGAGPKTDPKKGGAAASAKTDGKAPDAGAGKDAPKADDKKAAAKPVKPKAAKKKAKVKPAPVDVAALAQDVAKLKSRAFALSAEGTYTSIDGKSLKYLWARMSTGDRRATLSDTVDVVLKGSLSVSAGAKEAPGFTPGSVFVGPIRQVSNSKADVVGTLGLSLGYHPDGKEGYEVSFGGGFKENQFEFSTEATSSNLASDKNNCRITGKLFGMRAVADNAEWKPGVAADLEYKKEDSSSGAVAEAKVGAEVQDVLGENNVQLTAGISLDLGEERSLGAAGSVTVFGDTAYSFKMTYGMPLVGALYMTIDGGYEGTGGQQEIGMPNSGVSINGEAVPSSYTQSTGTGALKGNLKFILKNFSGTASPYLGLSATRTTSAVEQFEESAKRVFIVAGMSM